jgi:hypothetical protein
MVIIGTPNANGWGARVFGRYWINWHAPYHLHFFNAIDGYCRAARDCPWFGLVASPVRNG